MIVDLFDTLEKKKKMLYRKQYYLPKTHKNNLQKNLAYIFGAKILPSLSASANGRI